MKNLISYIDDSLKAKKSLVKIENKIYDAINKIYQSISIGGKIMLCGNGGSAADAQHLAAEFLIRLRPGINRKPIPAISLNQDTSTITACANDYYFDIHLSRCLQALGKKQDILIIISTSGNSRNIINVLKQAKKMNIYTIGFLGNNGGKSKKICDLPLIVGSKNTARIQEAHIFLGHYIFENVEELFLRG